MWRYHLFDYPLDGSEGDLERRGDSASPKTGGSSWDAGTGGMIDHNSLRRGGRIYGKTYAGRAASTKRGASARVRRCGVRARREACSRGEVILPVVTTAPLFKCRLNADGEAELERVARFDVWGHASAMTTLNKYGHMWPDADESARAAVGAVMATRADSLSKPRVLRTRCGPGAHRERKTAGHTASNL